MTNKFRIAIASAVLALPLALALPAMAQTDGGAAPERGRGIRLSFGERPGAGERPEMTDGQRAEMESRRAACQGGESDGCLMGGFRRMGKANNDGEIRPRGQGFGRRDQDLTEEQKKAVEPLMEKIRALQGEIRTIIGE